MQFSLFDLSADLDDYFDDLGVAYRAEINDLYEAGCRKFCSLTSARVGANITSAG